MENQRMNHMYPIGWDVKHMRLIIGYGHNGAQPGYLTMMRYHPGTHTSYILFVNYFDFDGFQAEADGMKK